MDEQSREERVEEIIRKLKCTPEDAGRVRRAYAMADRAHAGQVRKGGEPFVTHPLSVAEMLADMGLDTDSVIAGLLHDCIEDTGVTYEEIRAQFGTTVAELVDGVTKLTRMPYATKEEAEMENLRKMFLAMAHDIRVILIKLFDRLHNMRTLAYMSQRKQKEKALETMMVYAPIAHRLGMNSVKVELEDLSLQYLDPVGYAEIVKYLESSAEERNMLLSGIIARIEERLVQQGIQGRVEGRVKHIYGIYRKVYIQNKDLSEVYDIYAVRVIVETLADCYNVLGMIHELYKPMPGRFKDYISTPKPNMYQSLHTTVIGRAGKPFEVQIRTYEMHRTAEYGIAAHWKYKESITKTGDEDTFAWVRQLLEAQQDTDAEDFIKSLRIELFADEVFVFTPKGDVINLPAGATPIDFAYAIHSAVGNRMLGAKVNGRLVQLDHPLANGDIVEILTGNNARGPSRDWLKIVKTGEARNKIKQWFKKERREENIVQGREEFEAELKRNLLTQAFTQPELQQTVLKKLSFPTLDDLFASIGYGGVTARKAVNRVAEEVAKNEKAAKAAVRTAKPVKPTSGVIIEGVDNVLIKFARCCTPIPGDRIVGFVTKGYGVSVHRADCPNMQAILGTAGMSDRILKVRWASSEPEECYQTALSISAKNRIGLIADVATLFCNLKIDVSNLTAREAPDGSATMACVVQLSNAEQLGQIILRLKQVPGVLDVTRSIQ